MIDAATLNLDALGFDALMAEHEDASNDAIRARDVLAPLTWRQWCAWQAWAVCGEDPDALPPDPLSTARELLLEGVESCDTTCPKADPEVPVLRERDLMLALNEEELRLWLNHYVGGYCAEYLGRTRGWSVRIVKSRLATCRAAVELLLPPDCVGLDVACGQRRLTAFAGVL